MKQLFAKTIMLVVLVAGANAARSQNSVELNWGRSLSLNCPMNNGFTAPQVFNIGFFHQFDSSRFEVGLKWNREHYFEKNHFFSEEYNENFRLHFISVAGRYYLLKTRDVSVFSEVEAGFHHFYIRESKNGSTTDERRSGFSFGAGLGSQVKLSERFLLGAGLHYNTHLTDQVNFEDKISVNHIEVIAGTLGVRFLLKKKKIERDF